MLICPWECHQAQIRAFIEVRVGGLAESKERCKEARDWETGVYRVWRRRKRGGE